MSNEHIEYEKKNRFKPVISGVVVLIAAALFLISPFFEIKTIEISEMKKYSNEELCQMLDIDTGDNLFLFGRLEASRILKNNPYVDDFDISYSYPDTVTIEIKERLVRGYVPYMGAYLYIDDYGRVLEINKETKDNLPVVEGLVFDSFAIGDLIDAENKEAFDIMVDTAQLMNKYELLDSVMRIDLSDTSRVLAYVNNVEVNLGDMSDGDQKIRLMAEIIKNIDKKDRGTLDLSDISKNIVFKYLT